MELKLHAPLYIHVERTEKPFAECILFSYCRVKFSQSSFIDGDIQLHSMSTTVRGEACQVLCVINTLLQICISSNNVALVNYL